MLMESNYDKPMNIGSDRLVSIDQLADLIIEISGKTIIGRNADITLAKRILGWEPEISLEEGLSRTFNWIDKQVNS
jgi:GDP-D-mannose 3', 5'-epimerase